MNIGRNARIAKGTDENGVEVPSQHGEAVLRNSRTVGQIAGGAPVKRRGLDRSAGSRESFDCLGDYVWADSISGNDRDSFGLAHEQRAYQAGLNIAIPRDSGSITSSFANQTGSERLFLRASRSSLRCNGRSL